MKQIDLLPGKHVTVASLDPTDIYSLWSIGVGAGTVSYFQTLQYVYTYHCLSYTVTGTVYGAVSGTVTISLHRSTDGELLATTTRSGSGAWSMVWYDNVIDVYVEVVDNAGRGGRSADGTAGTDALDVILGVPAGRAA